MNFRSSNWTGRVARSVNEAFGPHATNWIEEQREPWNTADLVICLIAIAAVALLVGGVI